MKECEGLLINGYTDLQIPKGTIATKMQKNGRRQYAAHPSACEVIAVIFDVEVLCEKLNSHMTVP